MLSFVRNCLITGSGPLSIFFRKNFDCESSLTVVNLVLVILDILTMKKEINVVGKHYHIEST